MEAFPRSSTTIANPDQERIYNPKNIEASLDAVEGGMDEVSTDRDERLQRTQNLWHDMFENPDKDAEEFTPEQKIRFLNNIAESGVESVLSQLVAGSKGFNSFEDAMAEFGVNDHGVPIYGARVTNSIVKPNLSGQFWLRRLSDLKRSGISAAVGGTVSFVAITGLATLGILAAPASLTAIAVGGLGSAAIGVFSRGIADYFCRKRIYNHQTSTDSPSSGPEIMDYQGSIAKQAADEMVEFCQRARDMARISIQEANQHNTWVTSQNFTLEQIEAHELARTNHLLQALDDIVNAMHERDRFTKLGEYEKETKAVDKTVRKWGIVGSLVGGIGANLILHSEIVKEAGNTAVEYARTHGVWMHNGQLSRENVGHIVREVNGAWHNQISPQNTHDIAGFRDSSDFHGIIESHQLATDNNAREVVNYAADHGYGIHMGPNEQMISNAIGSPGIELHPDLVQLATDHGVNIYHLAQYADPSGLIADQAGLYATLLGFIQTAGQSLLGEPGSDMLLNAIQDARHKRVARATNLEAAMLKTNIDIPQTAKSPRNPVNTGNTGNPDNNTGNNPTNADNPETPPPSAAKPPVDEFAFRTFAQNNGIGDEEQRTYTTLGQNIRNSVDTWSLPRGAQGIVIPAITTANTFDNLCIWAKNCLIKHKDRPRSLIIIIPEPLKATLLGSASVATVDDLNAQLQNWLQYNPVGIESGFNVDPTHGDRTFVFDGGSGNTPNQWIDHINQRTQRAAAPPYNRPLECHPA